MRCRDETFVRDAQVVINGRRHSVAALLALAAHLAVLADATATASPPHSLRMLHRRPRLADGSDAFAAPGPQSLRMWRCPLAVLVSQLAAPLLSLQITQAPRSLHHTRWDSGGGGRARGPRAPPVSQELNPRRTPLATPMHAPTGQTRKIELKATPPKNTACGS